MFREEKGQHNEQETKELTRVLQNPDGTLDINFDDDLADKFSVSKMSASKMSVSEMSVQTGRSHAQGNVKIVNPEATNFFPGLDDKSKNQDNVLNFQQPNATATKKASVTERLQAVKQPFVEDIINSEFQYNTGNNIANPSQPPKPVMENNWVDPPDFDQMVEYQNQMLMESQIQPQPVITQQHNENPLYNHYAQNQQPHNNTNLHEMFLGGQNTSNNIVTPAFVPQQPVFMHDPVTNQLIPVQELQQHARNKTIPFNPKDDDKKPDLSSMSDLPAHIQHSKFIQNQPDAPSEGGYKNPVEDQNPPSAELFIPVPTGEDNADDPFANNI